MKIATEPAQRVWLSVHVVGGDPNRVEALLEAWGAVSITLTDAADQPLLEPGPGETPLWDSNCVTGLFEGDADAEAIRSALLTEPDISADSISIEWLKDRVWEREWLRDFKPMCFGRRLWISPAGQEIAAPDAVIVELDPGLAFGTGTHPSTRLCLEWLDKEPMEGLTVVDFGCGSGVLAIAAARLGAERVLATDIDPQALTATAANAQRNGVEQKIEIYSPDSLPPVRADVVLANILAGTLIGLSETISALTTPGGRLVMAGILAEQAHDVADCYSGSFEIAATISDSWARLDGLRIDSPA